jgi:argininosuccinate lyase
MSERAPDRDAAGRTGRLWGGGFSGPPDSEIERFCASFSFDRRLLRADVAANRAWVAALAAAGVLPAAEAERIDAALAAIGAASPVEVGAPTGEARPPENAFEDVHTFVEAALAARVGAELAGRLRTGRSRNDLVATDLRLYCKEEIAAIRRRIAAAVGACADLAARCGPLPVPGYTHMRRAQPILLAHLLLAHAARLMRDDDRFAEALRRADVCPLGCAALAGTTVPIDRAALARHLGFARPAENSLDAVSDRDFAADALYAAALLMVHLSQIAEDLVLASAEEFGWLAIGDAAATGSSLMPQKKNPDALELLRGKAGRAVGRLTGFLTTLKGLPAAYNRDLQEDKEPLFDALDTARDSLRVLALVLGHLEPVPARALPDDGGDLLATDLAEHLAGRGVPFAEAHRLAGEAAARARASGVTLRRLPLEVYRAVSPLFDAETIGRLGVQASLERRDREGGTAPARVRERIEATRAWVAGRSAPPGEAVP